MYYMWEFQKCIKHLPKSTLLHDLIRVYKRRFTCKSYFAKVVASFFLYEPNLLIKTV